MPDKFHELRLAAQTAAARAYSMFADLPSDDLARISKCAEARRADRGDYLFHEGDPVRGFFIIRQGAVNVHRSAPMGPRK